MDGPGTQAGKNSVAHIEIIYVNQNHFDDVEPINLIKNSQPKMMMAEHEQGVVID